MSLSYSSKRRGTININIIILSNWDRQASAGSVDPDQMPQDAVSNQVYTVCHSCSSFYTSIGSKMDLLNVRANMVRS